MNIQDSIDVWVKRIVNNFCEQTGQKDVHFDTIEDLLCDLDPNKAAVASARFDGQRLRPGPVPND